MQINIENGKRFNEEPAIAAVSSGNDIVLVRLADGTGVKALKLSALGAFITGDLSTLETTDKTSLVAALNEVLGDTKTNAQAIEDLETLTDILTKPGASRANSLIVEYDLGTSFTAEQSQDIRSGTFSKVRAGATGPSTAGNTGRPMPTTGSTAGTLNSPSTTCWYFRTSRFITAS